MKKFFTLFAFFAIAMVSMAQNQNVYEWKNGAITIRNTSEIDSITFALPDEQVWVATDNIVETSATTMTASYSASFSVNGSYEGLIKGVCYSPSNEKPTLNDSTLMCGNLSSKTWKATITGLTPNTSYYFRPFLRFNDKVFYGAVESFTTAETGWKSLGMGKFSEGFLGNAGEYFDVEIQQNELAPNQFRVVEPYAGILGDIAVDKYLEFAILPAGTAFKDYVLDAEYVVFNDYNMGQWNSNYAEDIFALHPYRFGMTLDLWAYNVVLDYQENGLPGEVSLAPYFYLLEQGGGWNQTKETTISILFPGYVKADYSSALEFAGLFTKPDGSMFAVANLALGADAAEVKAIVMPADADAAAVADAIAAGELEAMDVEAGRIEVPFNAEELGGNNFQIVTVVLFEGAVKSVAAASFEYYGGGNNPWQSLGTGHYTDDILSSMWGLPTATYEVEILEHTENPGLYRLVNPYNNQVYPAEYVEVFASQLSNSLAPAGYNLEVNAMDPEGVYIPVQALGLDFGDGEWSFETEGSRYLAKYDMATLKKNGYMGAVIDGVIKFPKFPFTASDGSEKVYQGILYEGASGYYSATNGQLEIVLPSANAFARNMAIAKSNTTKREVAKIVFSGVKATKKINKLRNLIAETF